MTVTSVLPAQPHGTPAMPQAAHLPDTAADPTADGAIAPRRPDRAPAPAATDTPEWRARPDTLPNLFLDIFDPEPDAAQPASRQRIAAAIRAREAAESPELLNLWHDAFAPDDPQDAAALVANDQPAPTPDDLDRLRRMREVLYAVDPDAPPLPVPSVQMRLAVHAMNGTLVAAAGPVGVAVMTYSLIRGENMRLTACAMVACGGLMAMLDLARPLI